MENLAPKKKAKENYNPSENVRLFVKDYGDNAKAVLEIFNEVDPRSRYFGDDVNPDEYVEHVKSLIDVLKKLSYNPTEQQIKEFVADSFSGTAEEDGFLNTDQIEEIGAKIFSKFYLN